MSRLIGYGTGEVVDRLTILELKILHGTAAGKTVEHFEDEHTLLFEQFWHGANNFRPVFERAMELAAVNAALWAAEDEMRKWRAWWTENGPGRASTASCTHGYNSDTLHTVAHCAIRIQCLNDQRAALVAQINTLAGDSVPLEKLT